VTVAAGRFAPGHLGELTQLVPFEMVDDALERTGTVQARIRLLPARISESGSRLSTSGGADGTRTRDRGIVSPSRVLVQALYQGLCCHGRRQIGTR
jgi:hypothetical protein